MTVPDGQTWRALDDEAELLRVRDDFVELVTLTCGVRGCGKRVSGVGVAGGAMFMVTRSRTKFSRVGGSGALTESPYLRKTVEHWNEIMDPRVNSRRRQSTAKELGPDSPLLRHVTDLGSVVIYDCPGCASTLEVHLRDLLGELDATSTTKQSRLVVHPPLSPEH